MMRINHGLGDGQAKPQAAGVFHRALARLTERVEETFPAARGKANSTIPDFDHELGASVVGCNVNAAPIGRKLGSIF